MQGQIDARFYGQNRDGYRKQNAAREFGGAFSFRDEDRSYIGIFGTGREYFLPLDKPTIFNYNTLTAFNDETRNGTSNNALELKVVTITKDANTNAVSNNSYNDAVVEFDYTSDGKFSWNGLRLYFADKKYSVTEAISSNKSELHITDSTALDGGVHTAPNELTLSRQSAYFGFNTDYMALVAWNVTESDATSYGFGIAGFASQGTEILTTDSVTFKGKGRGRYDANTPSNADTYFTVNTIVDFDARTVEVTSSDTCTHISACTMGGSNLRGDLNFTGTLGYATESNVLNTDAGNGGVAFKTAGSDGDFNSNTDGTELSGAASAQFYSPLLDELGGTFSLINSNIGYVGWFGTERNYLKILDKPTTTNDNGLTAFNDESRNSTSKNVFALDYVVQINKNTVSKALSNPTTSDALVELAYETNGDFTDNGFAFYFDEKKYTINVGTANAEGVNSGSGADDVTSSDADTVTDMKFLRNYFGFTANHMAALTWEASENNINNYGFGIVGFASDGNLVPDSSNVTFTGRGRGRYTTPTISSITQFYFDMTADVDFATNKITLESDKTCSKSSGCTITNFTAARNLNFKGELTYTANAASTNEFAISIKTAGTDGNFNNNNDGELSGTAKAKFYGSRLDEFGGTFNLGVGSTQSYVGWFGAERPYTGVLDRPQTTTTKGLKSFNDENIPSTRGVSMNMNGFEMKKAKTGSNINAISSNAIDDAVVQFDYTNHSQISWNSLHLYLEYRKYSTTQATDRTQAYINDTSPGVDGTPADVPTKFGMRHRGGWDHFGFTSNYTAVVYWELDETDYEGYGFGVTGHQTADISLPSTGATIRFSGRGRGHYSGETKNIDVLFGVTSDVNFATQTVAVTASKTSCLNVAGNVDCTWGDGHADVVKQLNFTGTLSYVASENALTGSDFSTSGAGVYPGLSGTAKAKFYGAGLQELGGTFHMNDGAKAGYVGWFVTERHINPDSNVSASNIPYVEYLDTPTVLNVNNLTSFNDSKRHNSIGNALKMNAVEMSKVTNGSTTTITNGYDSIDNATVGFDYFITDKFHRNGLAIYLDEKRYKSTTGTFHENYLKDTSPDSAGTEANKKADEIYLARTSYNFGFNTNYMALVSWKVNKTDYQNYGYGIAGFETAGDAGGVIPSTGTEVSFSGKGRGRYSTENSDADTFFNVDATADFSARTVVITGSSTCTDNSDCANTQRADLNFAGTLGYAENSNVLTTEAANNGVAFTTTAGSNQLTGTAEAKFYGPSVNELGGTFSMGNNDAGYVGFFGVKKQ